MRKGQPEPATVEVDGALVAAGGRERGERTPVERVLAGALVAQPRLRELQLALHDLADLHAREPERTPDRTSDDTQHRAVLARLGQPREGLPEPARARGLPGVGWLAVEGAAQHGGRAPQRGRVILGARAGDEDGGARIPERLDDRAGHADIGPALDDEIQAALFAQRETAVPLDPHRDGQCQPAMQERAGDVAQFGRRQVTRKRRGERIIKVLGRRADRVHTPQSSRRCSYTLAPE